MDEDDPPFEDELIGRQRQMFWHEELRCWIVKWSSRWVVMVSPMIFNDRVCLESRESWKNGYDVGWCYDKGPAAFLAAEAWDPDEEDEPVGYKKAVGKRDRRRV